MKPPTQTQQDHTHGDYRQWPEGETLIPYRLENGAFAPALIEEAQGATALGVLPGLEIQRDFTAG